jgi:hypothetical protein
MIFTLSAGRWLSRKRAVLKADSFTPAPDVRLHGRPAISGAFRSMIEGMFDEPTSRTRNELPELVRGRPASSERPLTFRGRTRRCIRVDVLEVTPRPRT